VADWTFTDAELDALLEWLFLGIPGGIEAYLNDHPYDLRPGNPQALASLAKRIRGQVRARLHNLRQNRALLGSVSEDGRHWFRKQQRRPLCRQCLLPSAHEIHRKCYRCGSPFHGESTCREPVQAAM